MEKFTPAASWSTAQLGPDTAGNCTIIDARSLLYQPALRAAVVREQVALLATRLAMARWSSGNTAADPRHSGIPQSCRAAFYARAQEDFFAWIERGGMWENDDATSEPAPTQNDGAGAVVRTTVLLQRSTPSEE